ncbi:phage tail tape measure protein [Cryobacterium sp. 10S3]|uniref:phage tail tape measure protein n=1 Tax=Cryobacterium sp. 10S3 TaxID=3048582 RepID=UPI002AC925B4|nr:phage tail tape measure protein [Cryobacterium sp. 10S3]MEB0287234.1 phage tail tape measure protein [Cryobacterium sp. 10S3]WPX14188.1 phage tail tape measure protein [Cryobacterium sp. 10S3]
MAYSNTIGIIIAAKDEASAVINKAALSTKAAAGEVNGLGNASSAAGSMLKGGLVLGLIAAAGESATLAIRFQQSMEMLHTNAGVAQSDIAGLSQKLLDMSGAVGQGPDQLAKAFYHIASAGTGIWDTAKQLDILKVAAEGAAIGQASLDDTTYALTSAMASNIGGVKNAAEMMAVLNATVGAGDMKLQDLNGALSTGILSTAATFGISVQSVGSALATLTDNGEHADEAATRLRMTFALMSSPSSMATKQLEALGLTAENAKVSTEGMNSVFAKSGLSTTKLADDLRKPNGIAVAIEDLQTHLKNAGLTASESDAMLSKAFGGGRTDAALLTLLQNTDRLDAKFKVINQNAGQFGQNYADQQMTTAQRIADMWAAIQASLIKVGDWLGTVADKGMKLVAPAFQAIADVWNKNIKPFFDAINGDTGDKLTQFFGVVLAGSLMSAAAALAIAAVPFVLLDLILAGIVRGAEWFATNFPKFIGEAVANVTKWWTKLGEDTKNAWDGVLTTISDTWNNAIAATKDFAKRAGDWARQTVSNIITEFQKLPGQIGTAISDEWKSVTKAFQDGFSNIVKNAPTWGKNLANGYMDGLKALADYDIQSVMNWGKGIVDAYNAGVKGIKDFISGMMTGLKNFKSDVEKVGKDLIKGIEDGWNQGVKDAERWAKDLIKKVGSGWEKAVADTQQWGKDLGANIKKGWDRLLADAQQWGKDIVGNIVKGLKQAGDDISKWFNNLPNTVNQAVTKSGADIAKKNIDGMAKSWLDPDNMKTIGDNILKGIGIAILAIVGGLLLVAISIVISLINALIWAWQQTIHLFAEAVVNSWNAVTGAFTQWGASITNWAAGVVKSIVDEFKKLPGQIGDAIGGATGGIGNLLGGIGNNIGSWLGLGLNHHALGTNFAPGGMTMVGENGPELVNLPTGSRVHTAADTQQMSQGGRGVTITGGVHIHNNMDEDKFLAKLGWRLSLA